MGCDLCEHPYTIGKIDQFGGLELCERCANALDEEAKKERLHQSLSGETQEEEEEREIGGKE